MLHRRRWAAAAVGVPTNAIPVETRAVAAFLARNSVYREEGGGGGVGGGAGTDAMGEAADRLTG